MNAAMSFTRLVLMACLVLTACAPRVTRPPAVQEHGLQKQAGVATTPPGGNAQDGAGAQPVPSPVPSPLAPLPPELPTGSDPARTAPLMGAAYLMARLNDVRGSGANCPNGLRAAAPAVRFQMLLTEAARAQAAFMANSGRVTHIGPDNSAPRQRVERLGMNAAHLSEIIYLQRSGAEEDAIRWWLNSGVHCAVMTDPRYTHVGASVTPGAFGTAFVVLLSGP